MGEILLITLRSLALAAPISIVAAAAYLIFSMSCLKLLGLSEVRFGLCSFALLALSALASLLTFLVLFAHFCRSF